MRTARVAVAAAWVLAAVVSPVMGYDYGWDPGKIQGHGSYMEAREQYLEIGVDGAWEYTLDFYTDGSYAPDFMVWGFHNADILNFADGMGGWDPDYQHNIYQRWDGAAAGGNSSPWFLSTYGSPANPALDYASYETIPDNVWEVPAGRPYAIDNPSHPPVDYAATNNVISCAYDVDQGQTYTSLSGSDHVANQDGLFLKDWMFTFAYPGHGPGLQWSLRVVVPAYPQPVCIDGEPGEPVPLCPGGGPTGQYYDGELTWSLPWFGGDMGLFPVLGMPEEPWVDWPGIIDAACDSIGDPFATEYDFDGDGDVDEDDVIFLIENLVEWSNATNSGTGTKRGDFDLDGYVNATDLAIMKAHFGDSDVGWADGNANCDDVVNATDLAILKATFGFMAPAAGSPIPEPATLGLLALGGLALLKQRKD